MTDRPSARASPSVPEQSGPRRARGAGLCQRRLRLQRLRDLPAAQGRGAARWGRRHKASVGGSNGGGGQKTVPQMKAWQMEKWTKPCGWWFSFEPCPNGKPYCKPARDVRRVRLGEGSLGPVDSRGGRQRSAWAAFELSAGQGYFGVDSNCAFEANRRILPPI